MKSNAWSQLVTDRYHRNFFYNSWVTCEENQLNYYRHVMQTVYPKALTREDYIKRYLCAWEK